MKKARMMWVVFTKQRTLWLKSMLTTDLSSIKNSRNFRFKSKSKLKSSTSIWSVRWTRCLETSPSGRSVTNKKYLNKGLLQSCFKKREKCKLLTTRCAIKKNKFKCRSLGLKRIVCSSMVISQVLRQRQNKGSWSTIYSKVSRSKMLTCKS